ncbi:hypothetical protein EDB19DRAFT_1827334 [Suillus lakei]|nr:hypothetical protein EDB19DRAFT_1827334 [Suillus lakei]
MTLICMQYSDFNPSHSTFSPHPGLSTSSCDRASRRSAKTLIHGQDSDIPLSLLTFPPRLELSYSFKRSPQRHTRAVSRRPPFRFAHFHLAQVVILFQPILSMTLQSALVRFKQRNIHDFDVAIELHQAALKPHPPGQSSPAGSLNNFAFAALKQRRRLGSGYRIDCVPVHGRNSEGSPGVVPGRSYRSVLAITQPYNSTFHLRTQDGQDRLQTQGPVGHTDRSSPLHNLVIQVSTEATTKTWIKLSPRGEALALCPVDHTDRSSPLHNLATQVSTEATTKTWIRLSHRREALALCPVDHTDRSSPLHNLATQVSTEATTKTRIRLTHCREALALCPVDHTDRSSPLHNLATQVSTEATTKTRIRLTHCREALALCPVDHTDRLHRGNDEDSDQANTLKRSPGIVPGRSHRSVLAITQPYNSTFHLRTQDGQDRLQTQGPVGHTDRSSPLHNLAIQVSTEATTKTWIRLSHRLRACSRLEFREKPWRCARSITQIGPRHYTTLRLNFPLADPGWTRQAADPGRTRRAVEPGRTRPTADPGRRPTKRLAADPGRRENETGCRPGRTTLAADPGSFEHRRNDKNVDKAITLQMEALALCLFEVERSAHYFIVCVPLRTSRFARYAAY